ncbi:MAG: hypothetical protein SFY66_01725 [Oculatellaceae cyanobacterium bins.114]|nr:hypothetical protein [Oculatellaceae cyanobacterium bins.114]
MNDQARVAIARPHPEVTVVRALANLHRGFAVRAWQCATCHAPIPEITPD